LESLYQNDFPVPRPIDFSRHVLVMSLVDGPSLFHLTTLKDPERLLKNLLALVTRLAEYGLIHGDFNEFNIMILQDESPVIIDFPQMISINHPEAEFYFDRDVHCLLEFFAKKFTVDSKSFLIPKLKDIERKQNLDEALKTSGFIRDTRQNLNKAYDLGDFNVHLINDASVNDDNLLQTDDNNTELLSKDSNKITKWIEEAQSQLIELEVSAKSEASSEENTNEDYLNVCQTFDSVNIDEALETNELSVHQSDVPNVEKKFAIKISSCDIKRRLMLNKNCSKKKVKISHNYGAKERAANKQIIKESLGWNAY